MMANGHSFEEALLIARTAPEALALVERERRRTAMNGGHEARTRDVLRVLRSFADRMRPVREEPCVDC